MSLSVLVCPLCLRQTPVTRQQSDPNQLAVVNFALDNILDGLRAMATEETMDLEGVALIPTLRFENKRLRTEAQDRDRTITELRQRVQVAERKIGTLTTALGIVIILALARWVQGLAMSS